MKTYIAHVIYRITCEGLSAEQYDEQWRLVYAADERQALNEAKDIAQGEECTFVDRHGRTVSWQLAAVKDLQPVTLENGALLFSKVKEVEPIAAPVWAQ